jgi:hypothetical protein
MAKYLETFFDLQNLLQKAQLAIKSNRDWIVLAQRLGQLTA